MSFVFKDHPLKEVASDISYYLSLLTSFGIKLLAIYVSLEFFENIIKRSLSEFNLLAIGTIGFGFFLLQFFLRRRFPQRYLLSPKDGSGYYFVSVTMCFALAFWIVTLVSNDVKMAWDKSSLLNKKAFEGIGVIAVTIPYLFMLMFTIMYVLKTVITFTRTTNKFLISVVIIALITLFTYSFRYVGVFISDENIIAVGKFIIGFAPLGWVYELFIGKTELNKKG